MACRIQNLTKHRLTLDLRGGGVIYLKPNEVSHPIREELLYDHIHLPRWLAQGLVRRMDAKMSEVLEHEKKAAAQMDRAPQEAEAVAQSSDVDEADIGDTSDLEEAPEESSEVEKPKSRGRTRAGSSKTSR